MQPKGTAIGAGQPKLSSMASVEKPELFLFLLTIRFRCSIMMLLGVVVESPQEANSELSLFA